MLPCPSLRTNRDQHRAIWAGRMRYCQSPTSKNLYQRRHGHVPQALHCSMPPRRNVAAAAEPNLQDLLKTIANDLAAISQPKVEERPAGRTLQLQGKRRHIVQQFSHLRCVLFQYARETQRYTPEATLPQFNPCSHESKGSDACLPVWALGTGGYSKKSTNLRSGGRSNSTCPWLTITLSDDV